MFWKKKKKESAMKVQLGLDVKRCAECSKFTRPCLAAGQPATFHRWADSDKALLKINAFTRDSEREKMYQTFRASGVIPECCSTELLRVTFALVEYPDGTVGKVAPDQIKFLDRKEV